MKTFAKNLQQRSKKKSQYLKFSKLTDAEIANHLRTGKTSFLNTQEWKILRNKVIDHYGGKCMKCGCIPIKGINVDHIKCRKHFPELALVFTNLQVLCGPCNKRKGNKNEIDYRPVA